MLCLQVSFARGGVATEVEDGEGSMGFLRNSGCRERDTESRADPLSYSVPADCVLRMSVRQLGPGWVPDAAFSVAEAEGVCFVRVCGEIKELRSLSSCALVRHASRSLPASTSPVFHRRTRQLPPFKLPCLGLLRISCLSLRTPHPLNYSALIPIQSPSPSPFPLSLRQVECHPPQPPSFRSVS